MSRQARAWAIFCGELVLLAAMGASFVYFVTNSHDFLAGRPGIYAPAAARADGAAAP